MAAAEFPDLAEFIDDAFDLPYKGKAYRVPAPDAKTGIYLQSIMDAGESLLVAKSITTANQQILSDDQERTAFQMSLGSAYDEMVADAVPWPVLKTAGMTALLYWTRGPELAVTFWSSRSGRGNDRPPEAEPQTTPDSSPTDPSTPPPA